MAGKAKAPPSGLIVFLAWNAAPRREQTSARKPVCKRSLQRWRCAPSCSRGSLERQGGGGGWGSPCVVKYLRALNVDNARLPLRWASPERIALYCQVSVTEAPGNLTSTNFHEWCALTHKLTTILHGSDLQNWSLSAHIRPNVHHLIRRCNLSLHHPLRILLALRPFQSSPQTSCLTLCKCKRRLR